MFHHGTDCCLPANYRSHLITLVEFPSTVSNLTMPQSHTARFCTIPKLHDRPVVSICSCPPVLISLYLDSISSHYPVLFHLYYCTSHALHLFNNFQFPRSNWLIFSMDVQSLYLHPPSERSLSLPYLS